MKWLRELGHGAMGQRLPDESQGDTLGVGQDGHLGADGRG